MKNVLEEDATAERNYETDPGIPIGQMSGRVFSFWPEMLDTAEKTGSDEIQEAARWECSVDRTSVNALCQLHEVYIEEKR